MGAKRKVWVCGACMCVVDVCVEAMGQLCVVMECGWAWVKKTGRGFDRVWVVGVGVSVVLVGWVV